MPLRFTERTLAECLREAQKAHHVYEANTPDHPEDWATWYAAYVFGREHANRLRSSDLSRSQFD